MINNTCYKTPRPRLRPGEASIASKLATGEDGPDNVGTVRELHLHPHNSHWCAAPPPGLVPRSVGGP